MGERRDLGQCRRHFYKEKYKAEKNNPELLQFIQSIIDAKPVARGRKRKSEVPSAQ